MLIQAYVHLLIVVKIGWAMEIRLEACVPAGHLLGPPLMPDHAVTASIRLNLRPFILVVSHP